MKQFLARLLLLLSLALFFLFPFSNSSYSQTIYPGNSGTSVGARIGEFYLSISGYASPYASIVMTIDGVLIRSGVANQDGYFTISQILVSRGLDHFCLATVDFKRIGESEACLTIEPIVDTRIIDNIFLPPTIGVLRSQINQGDSGLIRGYSVPNATVTIKIKDGKQFTVTTDATGYYEYSVSDLSAGVYLFTSEAEFNSLKSLPPTKSVKLEVLTVGQAVTQASQNAIQKTIDLFTKTGFGFLILLLIIVIIIFILLLILRPRWLFFIFDKFKKKHTMHHDWYLKIAKKLTKF